MANQKHAILRFVHIDNLDGILTRGGIYAPNHTPNDGIVYKTIHSENVQTKRANYIIRVGPGGCLHDYVPFYFGYHSPMMLQLHTDQVAGYTGGQRPLVYLLYYVEDLVSTGCRFAFTDGHGIKKLTQFFDDLADLSRVDWKTVKLRYWADTADDNDRQRRKQAEFLVHRFVPWNQIAGIAVIDEPMKSQVERILSSHSNPIKPIVKALPNWYY